MRDHRTISIADQIFEQLQDEILSGKYKHVRLFLAIARAVLALYEHEKYRARYR